MPDLGGGHQLQHRIDHAEAGAKDRHQADPVAQLVRLDLLERGPDAARPEAGVGERLVAEQPGELAHDLAELLRLGPLVAQDGELVEHRGVPRNGQGWGAGWGG